MNNQLTRVCTSCGVSKPLSAFLQVSGTQGTTYGSICSDCRRTVIQSKPKSGESEEKSSSSSSLRIGSQQKVAIDIEKVRQHKDLKELYELEDKERDKETEKTLEKSEIKEKAEKDHRKFYIEAKKQGFLAPGPKKLTSTQAQRNIQQINTIEETNRQVENQLEENKQLEASVELESNKATSDSTTPFADPQFSDVRYTLGLKKTKTTWFRTGAPEDRNKIKKSFEQLFDKAIIHQKKYFSDKNIYDKKRHHLEKEKKDAFQEEIEKLKPNKPRRGR